VLSVPLEHREAVHGAICLYWGAAHRASDREVRLLTTFGEHAAAALEQGRLRDALAARVKRLETLTRLSQLISSSLDRDDVLREIASAATRLMNVPFAVIWVADEARGVVDLAAWSDPAIVADFPFRSLRGDRGIVGWIAEHRQAVNVADVFEDLRFVALDWWRAHQLRSFYGIPVVLDGCLLAVIELHGRDPIEPGPEERQLLDGFVAHAAVAIRNASMYRAEGEARMAAERALAQVNRLQGLLPICSYCKKIRNDRNYWEQIDTYISERSDAAFTHGICPECHETIVAPQLAEWRAAQAAGLRVDD
jgi:GAF domain-containing protein